MGSAESKNTASKIVCKDELQQITKQKAPQHDKRSQLLGQHKTCPAVQYGLRSSARMLGASTITIVKRASLTVRSYARSKLALYAPVTQRDIMCHNQ